MNFRVSVVCAWSRHFTFIHKVPGAFSQRISSLSFQPGFFVVFVCFVCSRAWDERAGQTLSFLTNFYWHSGFHEGLIVGSRSWRYGFVIRGSFVASKIVSWRGSNHFFVVFVIIVLAWAELIASVHILSWRFGQWPHWVFGLNFGVRGFFVRARAWGLGKDKWAVHVSCHDTTDFGVDLFFWLVLTWAGSVTWVFHIDSGTKSVSGFLFAAVLENCILEVVWARSRDFAAVFHDFGVPSESVSSSFLELWDGIILARPRFGFERRHASTFHTGIKNGLTSRQVIFIWRRNTWAHIGQAQVKFDCLLATFCWAWRSWVFSEFDNFYLDHVGLLNFVCAGAWYEAAHVFSTFLTEAGLRSRITCIWGQMALWL